MRALATLFLIGGVVFGFGSGFASLARHARAGCHGDRAGPGWGHWRRGVEPELTPAAVTPAPAPVAVQPPNVVVQAPQPAAAPAPIIVVVPAGQAGPLVVPVSTAPAPAAAAAASPAASAAP